MKTQPNLDERDQFDELLQAVGKSVEAKPKKGWEIKEKAEEEKKKQDSEKQD